jgi:hypothetical protein|uniref:Uncharacterized protein n=1 Tax=viral metagenome TaxID=1070528 RepID=A0A6C0BGK5_9ZZZZ
MVRKTRKNIQHRKEKGVYSIPQLRRSFEYIERSVDEKIHKKDSRERITRELRNEWHKVFMKVLDKKSAEAFIDDRMKRTIGSKGRRRTLRTRGGAAIAGAPLDYITRQGVYLAPGLIPDRLGHLPLTGDKPSDFGSYLEYVSKGFSVGVPEPGQSYDPVPGQTSWPQVPAGMGSNAVHFAKQGGSRRKIRRGGGLLDTTGAILSQAFSRPFGAGAPPGFGQNMQSMWYGTNVGPSPDQVQRQPQYQLGSIYPKAINLS